MKKSFKALCTGAAVAALTLTGVAAIAPQADAASCRAWRILVDDRGWLPDMHRAQGSCTYISSTERVQVRLDSIANFDSRSDWFTRTYTTYSTGKDVWTRGAYYIVRPR